MSSDNDTGMPLPGAADLKATADQVAGSADALTEQLSALRTELHEATAKANKDVAAAREKAARDIAAERRDRRRAAWKFATVVIMDVVLSLVSLGLYISQGQTNDRLEKSLREDYTTAQQQQVTREHVLCPLYTVLLTAASTPNPEVAATPVQKSRLAAALATIEDGYRTLGCKPAQPG